MHDNIVAAEYTNADHSELEWVALDNSRHRIRKDESPAFWNIVHQRAILRAFGGAPPAGRMIDITPPVRSPRLTSSPSPASASSAETVEIQRLRARVDALERENVALMEFAEIEVAAEAAIIAMQPDGAVDPVNKAWATETLGVEASVRGMTLESLCPALVQARNERNRSIMAGRIERLKAGN